MTPFVRIRSDFDRSSDIDDVLFQDFINQEVEDPIPLTKLEENIVIHAMKYRALEESEHSLPFGGRRNSLRPSVLVNGRSVARTVGKNFSMQRVSARKGMSSGNISMINTSLDSERDLEAGRRSITLEREEQAQRVSLAFESR